MRKYSIIILALINILSFFCSCEYRTEEDYFIDLRKPSENVSATIDLRNIAKDETIYIYTITSIEYNLDTDDKKLLDISFTIDDKAIGSYGNIIYISPYNIDNKDHILKVKISLSSNTGSLAEKLHLEKYTGEFFYKVKFVKTDLKLNISQQTTEDGFLNLVWDDPNLQQTPVDKYIISYYDTESQTIKELEVKDNSFVDETYIYGFREYIIKTYFEDNKIQPWIDYFIAEYKGLTIDDLNLNLHQEQTQEGYLKLIWNNPQIKGMSVKRYILEYYDEQLGGHQTISITPTELKTTNFIDENYAYGDREYRLTVDLDYLSISTKYIPIYRKLTKEDLTFEDIDLETVRVTWPGNEFNCLQVIRLFDKENIKIEKGVNHLDFKRLGFPYITWHSDNDITLYTLGKESNYNTNYSQGSVTKKYLYDKFDIGENSLSYTPDVKNNLLYIVDRRGIYSTNMKTKETKKHLDFNETISISMKCSQYSPKIVVRNHETVYIYNDKNFTNPITFTLQYGAHPAVDITHFTSDGKLLISMNTNYEVSLMAFEANTGKYLYTIPTPQAGNMYSKMRLSADGKYVLLGSFTYGDESSMQTDIFEIKGNKTELIKSFTYSNMIADGSFISFNPVNPNQLIQGNNNKFKILSLPSLNILTEIEGEFSSVDVANGNILYKIKDGDYQVKTQIIDPTFTKKLLSIDLLGSVISYNNILVGESWEYWGYYFDVSKFMKP